MNWTSQQYYEALGLKPGAGDDEIKSAYRKLAKQFHPDRNKETNAEAKFLLITEAYEFLTSKRKPAMSSAAPDKEELRKQARQRAARAARMRYEEFLQSDYYKTTSAISSLVDVVIAIAVAVFAIWLPVATYLSGMPRAAWLLALINFSLITLALVYAIKQQKIKLRTYTKAFRFMLGKSYIIAGVLFLLNLAVLFSIGFRTLIPLQLQVLTYAGSGLFGYALLNLIRAKRKLLYTALMVSIPSLLLVFNYSMSKDGYTQQYVIVPSFTAETLVHFSNGELQPYAGARFFFDYTEVRKKSRARYHFAFGGLGWVVVKQRELLP